VRTAGRVSPQPFDDLLRWLLAEAQRNEPARKAA
jgi:hypothetical protein